MKGRLIADAGSSKTHWSLLTDGEITPIRFETEGINPAHESDKSIALKMNCLLSKIPEIAIDDINFFGAGCGTLQLKNRIKDLLINTFNCKDVYVDSDLIAASIALFGEGEGLTCILGTGSNSGYYANGKILSQVPSLGFILGDEGSGSAMGKSLLNAIFKRRLPANIIESFQAEYGLSLDELIDKVYRTPKPAAFIAGFAPFLLKNISFPEIEEIVEGEIEKFFINNLFSYHLNDIPVGFVGSIAFSFKDIVKKIAKKNFIIISNIIKAPMPELEKYFLNK